MNGTVQEHVATEPTVSAEAFFDAPDDGFLYELVRGEVRRMTPAGFRHGAVAAQIVFLLQSFVKPRGLGVVGTAETGFVLARGPDTVRAPDVWFVARDRIPAEPSSEGFGQLAPDLAVEVMSPSDRPDDVQGKILEYFAAGTRAVWVAFPRTRTVTVYRAPQSIRLLSPEESLSGEDVVPGFSCRVAELFE
jgi:Uma2 family endonuclease